MNINGKLMLFIAAATMFIFATVGGAAPRTRHGKESSNGRILVKVRHSRYRRHRYYRHRRHRYGYYGHRRYRRRRYYYRRRHYYPYRRPVQNSVLKL